MKRRRRTLEPKLLQPPPLCSDIRATDLPSPISHLPSPVCPYAASANARLTARRAPRLMLRCAARA